MADTVYEQTGGTSRETYDERSRLYNSRIIKVWLDYINKNYPDIDMDEVLEYAGISRYAAADQAQWFNQQQVDRFNEILADKTGNPNIARDAGRFAVSSNQMGAAQQYTIGLMGLSYVYLLMGKLYGIMSKGAIVTARRLRRNKVEIISRPAPGVSEKPYQCQNRFGIFESLAMLFTNELAHIDHPECYHQGADVCRYIVTWKRTASFSWRLIRNLFLLVNVVLLPMLFVLAPFQLFGLGSLISLTGLAVVTLMTAYRENAELKRTITVQGDAAKDLIDEIDVRHANTTLVQEIGQALTKTLDVEELTRTVVKTMVKRTKFERGLIMLADREKRRLVFRAGYGYSKKQEGILKENHFRLDNPDSKGPFVLAFREQTPFLIEDITKPPGELSQRSREVARALGVKSLIVAPILFKNEALGVLAVDNKESNKNFDESDLHLVVGVASQTAAGIANANYFRKIRESEKEYRQLVESAHSIILRMDRKAHVTFFNDFAQNFFGCSECDILGKNILSTMRKETSFHDMNELLNAFEENPHLSIVREKEHVLEDGQHYWITWTFNPIFDDEENFSELLCIGSDITELRRARQEKRDLQLRLQRAEKMEAIGTLAGGVAHDLNNILAGLVTYPQGLLMRLSPDEKKFRQPLQIISEAGEKAAAIVQDLLTLARRGVTDTKALDFNQIVLDFFKGVVYANLRMVHPKVEFERAIADESLFMMGSSAHLTKVIMNLITNGAEAMPNGGLLSITTERRCLDRVKHAYEAIPPGDYAVLSVRDTGIGIPAEDQSRIFEPFYTKKVMARSGTGLGMAVVWGTVKDHEGLIDLQSTVGAGTKFDLYFPLTEQRPAEERPFILSEYMGNGETVLVVDDVKEQRHIASQMLTQLGYSVATAPNGKAAVAYLHENSVRLLLLDMLMTPDCDGLETYREILKIHPGQKAIIASGYSQTARVREAQKLGAGAYIKKPYTLEALATTIKKEISCSDATLQKNLSA